MNGSLPACARRYLRALALLCLVAACDRGPPVKDIEAIDVGSDAYPTDFTLTDHRGKAVRLSDFRGRIVALFFGFTQCPDVCPTTLSDFAQVNRNLGRDAERLQVLFVTIDPERDTQQLLAEYIPAFDARFIGLRGSPEEIRRVADGFKVTYRKIPAREGNFYTLDHTAYVFLFDKTGRLRLKVPHGQSAEALTRLVREVDGNP
jgi:protein SCO1/2